MSTAVVEEIRTRVDSENPWPGPLPFDETAEEFFHGRTEEAADLRRLVLDAPFTVLFGASGLGKTSLLQAGLFPLVRADNLLPIYVRRLDLTRPALSVGEQLKSALEREKAAHRIEAPPFQPGESLWRYLHRAGLELWSPQNRLMTPLFVLDQFEDVFTLGARNQAFIEQMRVELADLIENRIPQHAALAELEALALDSQRYKVLISFRREFLPDFEDWKRQIPSIMRNRLHLLPMSGEQALEAIRKSAAHLVDETVARRIVQFVAAAQEENGHGSRELGVHLTSLSVEPALLSIFCQGLNERRKARSMPQIDEKLLDEAGGKIIEDFYQRAISDQPEQVRSFIANELITEAGFRDSCDVGDVERQYRVTREQLDVLVDRRLLRIEPHGHTDRVELTHDVLTPVVREERERFREQERAGKQRKRMMLWSGLLLGLFALSAVLFFLLLDTRREAERANAERRALHREILQARSQVLDDRTDFILNLADEVIGNDSPLMALYAHRQKALALSALGNHAAATEELNAILEADPRNLSALRSRGYEYLLVGRPEDSIHDSEASLNEIPRDEITLLNVAIARAMLGRYPQAQDALQKAIASYDPSESGMEDVEVSPDIQAITGHPGLRVAGWQYLVALHYEAAVLAASAGDQKFEDALKAADDEAGQHPNSDPLALTPPLLAMNWAWLQARQRPADYGLLAASGALWERVAKIQAKVQPDLKGCATVEYTKFQKEHSRLHLSRYNWLAKWVSRQKKTSAPCNVVSPTVNDPRDLTLEADELAAQVSGEDRVQLAQVEKKLTQAVELLSRDPKEHDSLIELLIRRAGIRYRAKDYIGVREDCNTVLSLNRAVPYAHYYLAKSDWDSQKKLDHFEKALQYAPSDALVLLNFADFLRKDHPDRALSLLERCARLRPNSWSTWGQLSEVQFALHHNQQALESLNKAIALNPTDQELYESRETIEKQLGADASAIALHLAAGYRDAGDAERHIGHSAHALAVYLRGLRTVCSIPSDNADINFELERSVRNLSDFLSTTYSKQYAMQFWQILAADRTMGRRQNRAVQEAQRLQTSSYY